MSYILEALRKVERQRRAREIPDLATVHGPSAALRVRSWTPVVLGALAANALVLMLLVWYRPWGPPAPPRPIESRAPAPEVAAAPPVPIEPPAGAAAPMGTAPAPPAAVAPPPSAAIPAPPAAVAPTPPMVAAVPSPAAPAAPPAGAGSGSVAAVAPSQPPAVSAPRPPASAPGSAPMVEPRLGGPDLPAQPGSSAGVAEPAPRDEPTSRTGRRTAARQPERSPEPPAATTPRRQAAKTTAVADLPEPFREAVSELRLEALVFADSPKDRKVFINGRRYMEGDKLEDGILVERIIEEGAILSHGGHRFVLRHFR